MSPQQSMVSGGLTLLNPSLLGLCNRYLAVRADVVGVRGRWSNSFGVSRYTDRLAYIVLCHRRIYRSRCT